MRQFNVPTQNEVSPNNQEIFANIAKGVGFVPNIYATMAKSENALGNFLTFANGKSSLRTKEKEVINLVVSEINNCIYCKAAHTAIGKMNGFSDDQILDIRSGKAPFDAKLNALAKFAKETSINRGRPSAQAVENFFEAGYTEENLVDTLLIIGEITVTNYLHGITKVPVDFPAAPELAAAVA